MTETPTTWIWTLWCRTRCTWWLFIVENRVLNNPTAIYIEVNSGLCDNRDKTRAVSQPSFSCGLTLTYTRLSIPIHPFLTEIVSHRAPSQKGYLCIWTIWWKQWWRGEAQRGTSGCSWYVVNSSLLQWLMLWYTDELYKTYKLPIYMGEEQSYAQEERMYWGANT